MPTMGAGFMMVADGTSSRTALSPAALERMRRDAWSGDAAMSLKWTKRSTWPASATTFARRLGHSACTSSKVKFIVSVRCPTRLMTTLERAIARLMKSVSLRLKSLSITIWPRSPICFMCCVLMSVVRLGTMTCEPRLPSSFTTYEPTNPYPPNTVAVIPLAEDLPPAPWDTPALVMANCDASRTPPDDMTGMNLLLTCTSPIKCDAICKGGPLDVPLASWCRAGHDGRASILSIVDTATENELWTQCWCAPTRTCTGATERSR
mmetsp:Transcript_39617/g.117870  ORF Transcript_39617/g.117870 Transcript_39617/m.117870 type:complete len:264 (-) Transcript_39617:8-799(-)